MTTPLPYLTAEQAARFKDLRKAASDADQQPLWSLKGVKRQAAERLVETSAKDLRDFLKGRPSVSKLTLTKRYGKYALPVLLKWKSIHEVDVEETEDAKRRPMRQFVFLIEPPTPEQYTAMLNLTYTKTAEDLISDAFSEIEGLVEELRSWYENLPEQFQDGDKGQQIEAAADVLESMHADAFEAEDPVGLMPVLFLPNLDSTSRSDRLTQACGMLTAVADEAGDAITRISGPDVLWPDWAEGMDDRAKLIELLTDLVNSCQGVTDGAESIEFPGMF